MFERNMLTFSPGWDRAGNTLAQFTDVRELQRRLKRAGVTPMMDSDESGEGPASSWSSTRTAIPFSSTSTVSWRP
jgi:lactoylglutathione lyase